MPIPKFPQPPKIPRAGLKRPRTGVLGRPLAPLVGPKTPPPPDAEESLEERWRAWQGSVTGNGTASILEYIVWEWLVTRKNQQPDVDFIFQYPLLGGRTQLGGFVADFYFPARREVWNPAGQHFHWTNARDRARDKLARLALAGKGIKLIFLWEQDLLNRPEYTLRKAWEQSGEIKHGTEL